MLIESSDSPKRKKLGQHQRARVWKQKQFDLDPHCRLCGILMCMSAAVSGEIVADNIATVEHTFPVGSIERALGNLSKVLACHGCNRKNDIAFKRQKFFNTVIKFGEELEMVG